MKKVILNSKQLTRCINEEQSVISFTGDNAQEMGKNAAEKYNDAVRAGIKPSAIKISGQATGNNTPDNQEATVAFDTTQSNISDAVKNAVNTAVGNGADINKLNVVGDTDDVMNSEENESKAYTKKAIEEARLRKIRTEGQVFTKKQLNEEFASEKEFIDAISNKLVYEVLDAYKIIGDPQELATARDMYGTIYNRYMSSSPELKEKFEKALNGEEIEPEGEPIDLDLDF